MAGEEPERLPQLVLWLAPSHSKPEPRSAQRLKLQVKILRVQPQEPRSHRNSHLEQEPSSCIHSKSGLPKEPRSPQKPKIDCASVVSV